jgi:hypothetical protein
MDVTLSAASASCCWMSLSVDRSSAFVDTLSLGFVRISWSPSPRLPQLGPLQEQQLSPPAPHCAHASPRAALLCCHEQPLAFVAAGRRFSGLHAKLGEKCLGVIAEKEKCSTDVVFL